MTTVVTWNLRHGGGSRTDSILGVLKTLSCDILVLTEFRNNRHGEKIKAALKSFGYSYLYTTSKDPKLNSVLIASRQFLAYETFSELSEHQQRVIKVQTSDFTLFGTYFPIADLKKYVFDILINYIIERPSENIIITGDINTGKHFLDEKGATFFHSKYLDKFEEHGFVDAWRKIHGEKREYSWYSSANNGFRIDHFFVNGTLKERIADCFYSHQPRIDKVSDHSLMTLKLH